MKLIDTTCPKCGADLHIDADRKSAFCEYCGGQVLIDDEVQHLQIDNAESAGYAFEKGRQRAQQEARAHSYYSAQPQPAPKKNKKIVWWVLGWIFIFPVPLTIIIAADRYRLRRCKQEQRAGRDACNADKLFTADNGRGKGRLGKLRSGFDKMDPI